MGYFQGLDQHDHTSIAQGGPLGLDTVGLVQLINDAVSLAKMSANSVGTDELIDNAVSTAKFINAAVTQAKLAKPSVGTPELKTALGSATVVDSSGVIYAIVMNDYSFAPALYSADGSTTWGLWTPQVTDPSNTIARIAITGTSTGVTFGARWRYITASDRPTIWAIFDPKTGTPVAVWVSDDPITGDLPGIDIPGLPAAIKIDLSDLAALNIPASAVLSAGTYISAKNIRMDNLHYRALQFHSGDAAPSKWIFDNCHLDAGGKLALRPGLPKLGA